MRHIPLHSQNPDAGWVTRADALVDELRQAPDSDARAEIIDRNSALWGELKQWLLQLSGGKCWFSEAKDCFNHWDVEHYRPKKKAKDRDGTPHDAYWWLAFDWKNFRICGNVGNRKKGTYFPLREEGARCLPFGDLRFEQPLLLDPTDESDPGLLFFNLEGRAVPAPHVDDAWEKDRVAYSVERCNLDFPPLMDARRTIWNDCWNHVQEYLQELSTLQRDPTNGIARNQAKLAAKQLRRLIHPDREFSTVARACIESTGDPRLAAILRSS